MIELDAVLLEAIEAMRLRREAKRGAPMRPASQARRAGSKRRAPECASRAPRASREAIASMRLLFVGRIGLQPANLRIDPVHLSWITNKNDKNQPFY